MPANLTVDLRRLIEPRNRCIVPERGGEFSGLEFRTNLWDKYFTVAPAQHSQYGPLSNKHGQQSLQGLATRPGINPKTVAQWRKRPSVLDAPMGPVPASTGLRAEREAMATASAAGP